MSLQESTSVHYEDTFLLVGGYVVGSGQTSSILRYNPVTENWTSMPGKLSSEKETVSAVLVNQDSFPNC